MYHLLPHLPAKGVGLHPGSGAAHCMLPTCSPEEGGHTLSVWGEAAPRGHLCIIWRDTAGLGPLSHRH